MRTWRWGGAGGALDGWRVLSRLLDQSIKSAQRAFYLRAVVILLCRARAAAASTVP